jgi:hypothetical protein
MLQLFNVGLSRLQLFAVTCALVLASLFMAPAAMAQTTIDTTEVTGFITGQIVTGIGAIGAVFLLVAVVFAGYRWIRGAAGGN